MTANDKTNEKQEAGTKDSILPTYICSACTQIFQEMSCKTNGTSQNFTLAA